MSGLVVLNVSRVAVDPNRTSHPNLKFADAQDHPRSRCDLLGTGLR